MTHAALPIAIGLCAILIASACTSSPPRDSAPPQVGAQREVGNPGAAAPAGTVSQAAQTSSDGVAPAQAANVQRSQADVDKAMKKRGYKPSTYRGERVYCRDETLTGSNLESRVCLTPQQIDELERSGKDILNGNRQAGCLPTKSGCN